MNCSRVKIKKWFFLYFDCSVFSVSRLTFLLLFFCSSYISQENLKFAFFLKRNRNKENYITQFIYNKRKIKTELLFKKRKISFCVSESKCGVFSLLIQYLACLALRVAYTKRQWKYRWLINLLCCIHTRFSFEIESWCIFNSKSTVGKIVNWRK